MAIKLEVLGCGRGPTDRITQDMILYLCAKFHACFFNLHNSAQILHHFPVL